jgi:hypothetical protein
MRSRRPVPAAPAVIGPVVSVVGIRQGSAHAAPAVRRYTLVPGLHVTVSTHHGAPTRFVPGDEPFPLATGGPPPIAPGVGDRCLRPGGRRPGRTAFYLRVSK